MDEDENFYANSVNVITSVYDITLNFSARIPISSEKDEAPEFKTSDICNVRMSPQHTKALAALLVKHIKQYESDYKIVLPIPKEVNDYWNEFVKDE